jgi:hypothetical protein
MEMLGFIGATLSFFPSMMGNHRTPRTYQREETIEHLEDIEGAGEERCGGTEKMGSKKGGRGRRRRTRKTGDITDPESI